MNTLVTMYLYVAISIVLVTIIHQLMRVSDLLFDDYNIMQHVFWYTHNKGNILDLIATSEGVHVIYDLDIRVV